MLIKTVIADCRWPVKIWTEDCRDRRDQTVGERRRHALHPQARGRYAGHLDLMAGDLPDNLSALRAAIERAVPHGRTDHGGANDKGAWSEVSHGAGRKMGRREAKRRFTVADLEAQTAGIECRKDADVIDEIPAAYKPIGEVMANQTDLVDVVHRLRQVVNVKG